MKQIILCADDYGLEPSISKAILELAKHKRLSATSCITTSASWPEYAKAISSFAEMIDIGLHINLTEGQPLSASFKKRFESFPTLFQMIQKAHFRLLDKKTIFDEIESQIMHFKDHTGFLPHFLDGHHHIINFPVIQDVLLDAYHELLPKHTFIRVTNTSCYADVLQTPFAIKKTFTGLLGGWKFHKKIIKNEIPHNQSFQGFYNFQAGFYRQTFKSFLFYSKHNGIIMCHPGLEGGLNSITRARLEEYNYFRSQAFLVDLERYNVALGRISDHQYNQANA